jgi:hypothetical protein
MLRGAGVTTDGTLAVAAEDLVAIPGSTGALLADAGGGVIGVGSRAPSALGDQLHLAVVCGPRP